MSKSLLILFNIGETEKNIKSLLAGGKLLWSGKNGFELIGKGKEEWDKVLLVKFRRIKFFQETLKKLQKSEFNNLKVILVKPVPQVVIGSLKFLMRRFFSILPKIFYLTEKVNYDLLNSPHLPSKEQFSQLLSEKLNEPVDMLNFLKYLNKADYQNKTGTSVSGKKAYSQYSKRVVRIIPKLGGCIQHTGKVVKPIIGELEQEWESFAIMRYFRRKTFEDMFRVRLKKEHRMTGDREDGLDKTKVVAFNPK